MKNTHLGWMVGCALLAAWAWIALPLPASADLQELTSSQLSDITGTGFSKFVFTPGPDDDAMVRADFNIVASAYADIGSLKMGYWAKDGSDAKAWDQNWQGVQIGTADKDMTLSGFFIEANFQHMSDAANRKLTSVFFGFNQVNGDLQADFQSLSKIGVGGALDDDRANLGPMLYQFNNSELSFSFQLEGPYKGLWVRFGDGTIGAPAPLR